MTIIIGTDCAFYDTDDMKVIEFCPIKKPEILQPIRNQTAAFAPLPIRNELVNQCNALSDQIV